MVSPCPITKTIWIHWIFFVMLKNNSLRHCDIHQCFCLTLPAHEVKLNLIFNIRYDPFFYLCKDRNNLSAAWGRSYGPSSVTHC